MASVDAVVAAGQIGLANTYDYFDTIAQSASRIKQQDFAANGETCQMQLISAVVDKTATQLRFVLAAKQPDDGQTFRRLVEVLPPGATDKEWIRLRPRVPGTVPLPPLPAHWELRGDAYNDVLLVPAVSGQPFEGQWQFRSCILAIQAPGAAVAAIPVNLMMAVSVQTDIRLQGRILGLVDNQGVAGDVPTISAVLLDRVGVLKQAGTTMSARVEAPAGNFNFALHDDGLHGDGSANDGIFAAPFMQTFYGGGYNVVIKALTPDPAKPGQTLEREWNGGFWIKGDPFNPRNPTHPLDTDGDGLPDPWELRCKLDPNNPEDAKSDYDQDGLTAIEELRAGTSPCDADTDDGGENDGSEVRHGRNPLNPRDDKVRVLDIWDLRPLNKGIVIGWSRPFSYTKVLLFITPNTPNLLLPYNIADKVDEGETTPDGDFVLTGLMNGQPYSVTLQPVATDPKTGQDIFGPMTEPMAVTPKDDPDAPSGAIAIENGIQEVFTKTVDLYLSSSDQPLEGAAQSANAHQTDILSVRVNLVSGDVQVRVSNSADMAGAVYEDLPGAKVKEWTLDCEVGEVCRVYAQFRDGAGNESLIISDDVLLVEEPDVDLRLFMPFTNKNN
jgi:hypothetical protein